MTTENPAAKPAGSTILDRLGLHRPELRAWAMYDWANSAMVTTIVTAVFPIYFARVAASDLPKETATARYALASTLAMIIVAILAPVLGAIADYAPVKKKLLAMFLSTGVLATAGMFFIHTGDWLMAMILFIVAYVGAAGSFVFYDSLLPHIAHGSEMDRLSTTAYALGYLGGGLLLAANLAWIKLPHWFGLPSGENLTEAQLTLPTRLAFVSVAVWWFLFALPMFLRVPEPASRHGCNKRSGQNPLKAALGQLVETLTALRGFKHAFLLLLAFLIYNDGITTIYKMATIYGTELNIDEGSLITAILLVQFIGIPFAVFFGVLAGRIGAKRCVTLSLIVYAGISVFGYFMKTAAHFYILAILVAMVQGGSQALSRSLFATLIPKEKSAEFFALFAVCEKFAGILGPIVFMAMIAATGSSRSAVFAVILFFIVGGCLLQLVNVAEGQKAARAAEAV
jgi:UMF1 family MFS transporter